MSIQYELLQKTCSAPFLFEQRQRKCQLHSVKFRVPSTPLAGSAYCACREIYAPASAAAAQRRPRVHPVLLQALPRNLRRRFTKCCACGEICATGSCGPVVTARPSAPLAGSVYCACHEICTPASKRCACHEICGPAATARPSSPPASSVYCACHEICTPGSLSAVPATTSRRPRVV